MPPAAPWWERDVPGPRGPRHWLWAAHDAADTAVYRVATFLVNRCASQATRERAWAAGYARALGAGDRPGWWITYAGEFTAGNEAGWALRHASGDDGPGRCRLVAVGGEQR